jgi:hypothetical protein
LKTLDDKQKIQYLGEEATDAEIREAWQVLWKLGKELQEFKKRLDHGCRILYDVYSAQKMEKGQIIDSAIDRGYWSEAFFEEQSKKIMKDLSVAKDSLVCDQDLLRRVE